MIFFNVHSESFYACVNNMGPSPN